MTDDIKTNVAVTVPKYQNGLQSEGINTLQYVQLKQWIEQQRILPELSESQIKLFLHSCYYEIEPTKSALLSYYALRINSPELFFNRDPTSPEIISISELVYLGLLPGVTQEGYNVIVIGQFQSDATHYIFKDCVQYIMMGIDIIVANLELSPGVIIMIETSTFTFSHLRKSSLDIMKKAVTYFQDALPIRMKKMLLLNVPTAFNILLNMIQPFLNARMREAMQAYTKENTGYLDIVPKQILPKEYNGNGKRISEIRDDMNKLLIENKEFLSKENQLFQDLAKRQPKMQKKSFLGLHF